jgi:hypothetical protein
MNDWLIVIMSFVSLLAIYWVLFAQKKYNETFLDYFQPKNAEQRKKFEELQKKEPGNKS